MPKPWTERPVRGFLFAKIIKNAANEKLAR